MMPVALHRVRYAWDPDRQIEIEWAKGRGVPGALVASEPLLTFVEHEADPDAATSNGVPAICVRDDAPVLFERFQLRENTEYYIDITLPISKVEAETLAAGRRAWPFADRLSTVFRPDPARRWRETATGSVIVSGVLRLKNHAGIIDLQTEFGTPLLAEVVCRKINYLDEFQTLLNEVASELAELLLQYDSPVSLEFERADVDAENNAGLLFQLRHLMNPQNLPAAVEEVLSAFHSRLIEQSQTDAVGAIVEPEVDSVIENLDFSTLERGGPLSRLFRGHTPRELSFTEHTETIDTPENRYVKAFLEQCGFLVERLIFKLEQRRKPAAVREAQGWSEQINELLGQRVWSGVGRLQLFPSNSQILQKRRGYREVLQFDLGLHLGLQLSWERGNSLADGFLGDVRPVHEIYEYWCFFVLRRILRGLCQAELAANASFLMVSADGLQVRLEKGHRSRVSFHYNAVGDRSLDVCLFYNRRFKRPGKSLTTWDGSYSAFFDPDYSLLLTLNEGAAKRRHWLHFDAKYRMEMAEAEALFATKDTLATSEEADDDTEYDREIARLHQRDDLFKMHTYRDGILSSRGAYVLFPGNGEETHMMGPKQNLFVRHPSAFSGSPVYKFPSVGVFDLCPGRDDRQASIISDFLKGVFDTILTGDTYKEEEGLF